MNATDDDFGGRVDVAERVSARWSQLSAREVILAKEDVVQLARFANCLSETCLLEATEIAFTRVPISRNYAKTWKYFCGICWNKLRDELLNSRSTERTCPLVMAHICIWVNDTDYLHRNVLVKVVPQVGSEIKIGKLYADVRRVIHSFAAVSEIEVEVIAIASVRGGHFQSDVLDAASKGEWHLEVNF